MKALESQLHQLSVTMTDTQNWIEQLELGASQSYEAIVAMDRKLESSMEGLERRLEGSIMWV